MNGQQQTSPVRFCACRLAVAVGLVWGLGLFLLGVITIYSEMYGNRFIEVMGSIYKGYAPETWNGALWGLLWGFVDGFVAVLIIVGVYMLLNKWGGCCCTGKSAAKTPPPPPPGQP